MNTDLMGPSRRQPALDERGEIRAKDRERAIAGQRRLAGPHQRHALAVGGVAPDAANVKATRGEGLGTIGRREGIAAQAVVLLERDA